MPNYNQAHAFYAGVDLHARSLFAGCSPWLTCARRRCELPALFAPKERKPIARGASPWAERGVLHRADPKGRPTCPRQRRFQGLAPLAIGCRRFAAETTIPPPLARHAPSSCGGRARRFA